MLLLLQGDMHISFSATIVAACITVFGGAALTYIATRLAASTENAKSQGVLEQTLVSIRESIDSERQQRTDAVDELKKADLHQWKRLTRLEGDVNTTREDVARLEGRLGANRNTRGHSAGGGD